MLTAKGYPVSMEISGNQAMWRDPSTGDTPKSYPAPTLSAAKAIMEAIAFFSDKKAVLMPYKVEVCAPVIKDSYPYVSGSILRKKGTPTTMIFAEILLNVCYKIYGISYSPSDNLGVAHHLQDLFLRRLKKGQCFMWPTLGWKQFAPTYYGPLRETTKALPINVNIGSMPLLVLRNNKFDPIFCTNAKIEKGVLNYAERIEANSKLITVSWSI